MQLSNGESSKSGLYWDYEPMLSSQCPPTLHMWLYDLVSYQRYPQECLSVCVHLSKCTYLYACVYLWVCMYVYVWYACVYVWGIVCLPKEVRKCACVCICVMWGGVYVCGVYCSVRTFMCVCGDMCSVDGVHT